MSAMRRDRRRRRPAHELRRTEERLRLLVESVTDYAIFVLDPDGTVASWNPGAERLKGYTEAEVLGRHYSLFYPPEDREAGLPERLLATALEHGRVEHTGWRVRKDGSRFWADVVITALRDESGQPAGFAKVTRDRTELHETEEARERALTEQREAVARLRELDRWRRGFTDGIVHDLQSPVTAIDAFAHLIEEGDPPADERTELLERIRSNARTLQDLIDNLRADGLLAEGRLQLEREPIALRPFVARVLEDMTPVLAGHPTSAAVADVEVIADPRALERMLRNLLGNAARHTPPGTAVTITGGREADVVVLAVSDEGPGIAEHLLPRIFEPFESGAQRGTGLGLDITRRYVELHGGTVTAESTAGEGATFRLILPDPASPPHRQQRGASAQDA
jgi:PAS domain S-box-containing protein